MFTILPLSVAGAAFALLATGSTLNIFSMIGLLLLMGIVKKNSIILVDYALQDRERGADAFQAMLRAGPETRAPMSIAVLGGLSVSTVLSLLVVPAFYVIADRMKTRVGARQGKKPDAESGPHTPRTDEPRPATHG
ncbi:hypothetical protein BHS06_19270 [Myxococcus xanthus]|nr:hypothetical protein BHS06_19270 [Myxococcus xanthus]